MSIFPRSDWRVLDLPHLLAHSLKRNKFTKNQLHFREKKKIALNMAEKALADMLELIKLRDKILADEISIRNMIT